MNRFLIIVLLLYMASAARAESVAPDGVESLIAKLSDDDFAVREAAQKKLADSDESVLPALEKARAAGDAETASRIGSIIAKIRWADWTIFVDRYAVDMLTGNVRWKVDGNSWEVQCAQSGKDIFVQANGKLSRRTLKDGQVIWERDCEKTQIDVMSKPKLILFRTQGAIHAWSMEDGKEAWTIQNPADLTLIPGENTFLLIMDTYCGCFSAVTGQQLWKKTQEQSSAPMYIPGGDVLLPAKTSIARLASVDGHEIWSYFNRNSTRFSVRVAQPYVFVANGWIGEKPWLNEKTGTCLLDLASGNELFQTDEMCRSEIVNLSSPVLICDDKLRCFSSETWKTEWSAPIKVSNFDGVILLPDGDRIFVCEYARLSFSAALRCISAKSGEQLWKADVAGFAVSHSKYSQTARLELHGKHIFLISQQSGGDFIEAFGTDTGVSGAKWVSPR